MKTVQLRASFIKLHKHYYRHPLTVSKYKEKLRCLKNMREVDKRLTLNRVTKVLDSEVKLNN